jgi:transcriptional regulator with XRE-family HTH domain
MDEQQRSLSGQDADYGSGILHVFGRQLKLSRKRAGLERTDLGSRTGYSPATIASFEQGRRIPPPSFIDKADEVLNAGGLLSVSKEEVARAQYPAFFRDAARLEREALELHVYATQAVPGLLQTEEYARVLVLAGWPGASTEEVEQRVRVRMKRQSLIYQDDPLRLSIVLDEAALRRPVGGIDVMRRQLERLLQAAELPHITLQVLPLAAGAHGGMDGAFTILLFDEPANQNLVFAANGAGGLFLEKDEELDRYAGIFDGLRNDALSPPQSARMIATLAKEP